MSRSRNWLFTINNYTVDTIDSLTRLYDPTVTKYVTYGFEEGAQGTPHVQGLICFKNAVRASTLHAIFHGPLQADVRIGNENIAAMRRYCQKEGNFKEYGRVEVKRGSAGKDVSEQRYRKLIALCKAGNLDKVARKYPSEYFRQYRNVNAIKKDHAKMPPDNDDCCGVWIFGGAGLGKSHYAREMFPGFYDKPCNKWWDSYQHEEHILIDDFDKNHHVLAHHLKRWADKYAFTAEVKGSQIMLRPKVIVVTSQYSIEEIWEEQATRDALNRRFKKVHFISYGDFNEYE